MKKFGYNLNTTIDTKTGHQHINYHGVVEATSVMAACEQIAESTLLEDEKVQGLSVYEIAVPSPEELAEKAAIQARC